MINLLNLGIAEIVRDNIYKDFSKQIDKVQDWINRSFLTDEYKEGYVQIIANKVRHIGL